MSEFTFLQICTLEHFKGGRLLSPVLKEVGEHPSVITTTKCFLQQWVFPLNSTYFNCKARSEQAANSRGFTLHTKWIHLWTRILRETREFAFLTSVLRAKQIRYRWKILLALKVFLETKKISEASSFHEKLIAQNSLDKEPLDTRYREWRRWKSRYSNNAELYSQRGGKHPIDFIEFKWTDFT